MKFDYLHIRSVANSGKHAKQIVFENNQISSARGILLRHVICVLKMLENNSSSKNLYIPGKFSLRDTRALV